MINKMKGALEWLERKMDYILMAFLTITLVVAILSLLAAAVIEVTGKIEGNTEEQKETAVAVIAEIAMPDGSVVSGNVESYRHSGYDAWEITINGVSYTTSKANAVIIKGGAGIQEE